MWIPNYDGYDPNLAPGIDTFFSTVAFRYGHTELRLAFLYGNDDFRNF